MSRKSMRNLSKVLIATSFFLFAIASYLNLENRYKLEGLEIVSEEKNDSVNVDIPNNDDSTDEVVENDDKSKDTKSDDKSSKTTKSDNTKSNNTTKSNGTSKSKPSTNNVSTKKDTNTSSNTSTNNYDVNDSLRNSIENKYHIQIKYGSETDGYTVGGMGVKSITSSSQITNSLKSLNNCLSLYPSGLYREVTSSYPLTVYLINKYSVNNVTGVTDSTNRNVKMSIATAYPFNDSFHHETYHYLELYMKNRGMSYTSWNDLNPSNFNYGSIKTDLSYARTFSSDSYFVNDYAQSAAEEDRASTFEYMMANSKASCLNNGKPIYKKAKYMADTMDFFIDSCSSKTTERWERFL